MDTLKVTLFVMAILSGHTLAVLQDMTWVMDMDHISYHPVYAADQFRFKMNVAFADTFPGADFFVSYYTFSTVEHMGTHIDAPYHFDRYGNTMDKVPLEDLIGPLVKIDIQEKAKTDPDAIITVADLMNWEKRNGRIPDGSFILMSSGWDQYYGDNLKYVGTNESGGETHSPGFGEDAGVWLKNRNIKGIGVDTLNCDAGNAASVSEKYTFPVHQILLPEGKLCIENIRSITKVPECGAKLSALPIMLKNGTGTQARVFAEWYPDVGYMTDCGGRMKLGENTFMSTAGSATVTPVISLLLGIVFVIMRL